MLSTNLDEIIKQIVYSLTEVIRTQISRSISNLFSKIQILKYFSGALPRSETEDKKLQELFERMDIDLALLSETHLKNGNRFCISNYTTYRKDRCHMGEEV
jgi:glutathionyl-hydroquinone reductase